MTAAASMVDQAASLVRRARAGDQNAEATIYEIGRRARGGHPVATQAFAFVKRFIDTNPATEYTLGDEGPLVLPTAEMQAPSRAMVRASATGVSATSQRPVIRKDPEMRKSPLPPGALQGLRDQESFALCIVDACKYRHGLKAASVVLSNGPLLTNNRIARLGQVNFGHDESRQAFFQGVQFCGENDWMRLAPGMESNLQRCMAIGQCVGRARRLQAVRMPRSRISMYNDAVGWELGE